MEARGIDVGQTTPKRARVLKSRAYDTITDVVGTFVHWSLEFKEGQGLGRPGGNWCRAEHETSRNAFRGHTAAFFCASQVEYCRLRRSLAFTFITTRDVFDGLDLDFSWFRYQDQSNGSKTA